LINSTAKSSKIIVETSKIGLNANELLRKNLVNNKNVKFAILSNPLHIDDDNSIVINGVLDTQQMFIYSENNPWNLEAVRKLKEIYSNWVSNDSFFTTKSEYNLQIERLLNSTLEYQKISNFNSIEMIFNENGLVNGLAQKMKKDINSIISLNNLKIDTKNLIYLCELLDLKHISNYWSNVNYLNLIQITLLFLFLSER
jgi:hypothetical protein